MKIRKSELIHKLQADGYRFSVFSLNSDGPYTVRDAMWNYKDAVSHIRFVHHLVKNYPLLAENDKAGSLFLQRALGISFPLIVLDLETQENTQTSFTSCLFFVLIIENVCIPLGELRTRVKTTYHIGAPRYLKFLNPFIAWVLKRNYKTLSSTDIPIRERRGELRKWGYEILSDSEPSSYEAPLNISTNNLAFTQKHSSPTETVCIDLSKISPINGNELVGRSDHFGLRILRQGSKLNLFPRMCVHEGASLDQTPCNKNQMECPWHGKKIDPLGEFDLSLKHKQFLQSSYHLFSVDNQMLTIEYLKSETQKEVSFGRCIAHLS